MSVLTHPIAANTTARLMQIGTMVASRRMARVAKERLPEFVCVTGSIAIPTSLGPVRATIFRPPESNLIPAVHVNLHGGGYVLALTEMDDPICRAICTQSGAVVLNVDYAVAPQHHFPAPALQVHEVVSWIAEHGSDQGWDGNRLTIGGQSAGGGLTAAAARLALERKGPKIALQVLHYPPLDLSVPGSAKRSKIPKPMLRPWMADVFDTAYAPDPASRTDRLISPAGRADKGDITGIAPALVVAAENDLLRDEARRYADRLDRAGALVEYREVRGADHGYDLKDDASARQSYSVMAERIRSASISPEPREGPTRGV